MFASHLECTEKVLFFSISLQCSHCNPESIWLPEDVQMWLGSWKGQFFNPLRIRMWVGGYLHTYVRNLKKTPTNIPVLLDVECLACAPVARISLRSSLKMTWSVDVLNSL